MANDNTVFGSFELLSDMIKPDLAGGVKIPTMDEDAVDVDPEDLKTGDDDEPIEPIDDDEPVEPVEPKKKTPKEPDVEDAESVDDISEFEPEVASFFQEKLASELGWEFGEDEKFETVSDVVDYMGKLVEESSKPRYANDEVATLDEFVRNGGNLRDFYGQTFDGSIDLDKIDTDNIDHQKQLVKELLKEQGLKDPIITKRISRYEDTGVLQDEAEEALPLLTEIREEKKQKLLEAQRKDKLFRDTQQREFFSNVDKSVKEMKDIRGIPISDSEKKEILEYIFKPTSEGITQYQKDYMSNTKNLIESAYFTKKGDVLINRAKKQAASDTTLDLKKKIQTKKGNRLSGKDKQDNDFSSSSFGSLSNLLLKKV